MAMRPGTRRQDEDRGGRQRRQESSGASGHGWPGVGEDFRELTAPSLARAMVALPLISREEGRSRSRQDWFRGVRAAADPRSQRLQDGSIAAL
jgi:hypothetical protein